jgi:hypothetical protein
VTKKPVVSAFPVPSKANFLEELETKTPGWSLARVVTVDKKTVFALTPTTKGPMYIGDDIGINNPLIPINDHTNAFYGFSFGAGSEDLPDDPRELAIIWKQALGTYEFVKGKPNEIPCPVCKGDLGFGYGRSKRGHFCRRCFGLGTIYTYGPQRKLGKRLLQGSTAKIVSHRQTVKFQPNGLSALLSLYDTYHTGIVTNIAQDYLIDNAYSVLKETFPNTVIYVNYDQNNEPGLCDVVWDHKGKTWYRHFFMLQENGCYLNLFTGREEIPSLTPSPINSSRDLPARERWNITLDVMRNLCKFAK